MSEEYTTFFKAATMTLIELADDTACGQTLKKLIGGKFPTRLNHDVLGKWEDALHSFENEHMALLESAYKSHLDLLDEALNKGESHFKDDDIETIVLNGTFSADIIS